MGLVATYLKVFLILGKKSKKSKGKTVTLTDFLQETSGPAPTIPIRKSGLNWADEVEDTYGMILKVVLELFEFHKQYDDFLFHFFK